MKKFFVTGVAAAALCGVPALAADVPVKVPVYKAIDPGFSWTGWYGGVNVGVGISQTHGNTPGTVGSVDRSGAGFAGGVQGGYNWQFDPRWVAGIEGDIGYLGVDRSFPDWADVSNLFGVKTEWYGTIRGRLGYTNGPSLFYVTSGAAFVNVKNNNDGNVSGTQASKSETTTGWTVGGGIETMLGGNWSAKAEYLYIDAGSQDVFNPNLTATGLTMHFDNRFHVFRYGLNYKLGGPGMVVRVMPSYTWTGFYVGVNAGAGLSQDHADTNGVFLGLGAVDIAGSGFTGGVQGGYNWQFNPNWVAGIETDIGYLGIDRSRQNWNDSRAFGVKTDWYGTIRGRLGYSTGPALLYVTGGAAFVNVKNNFDEIAVTQASKSETATGWTVGGGIEAALAQNWTAKTEYLYIDAGSQDVFNPVIGGGSTTHFNNRFHVFRFGLNYKFGDPWGKAPVVAKY